MVICITKLLLSEKKELSKIWLAAHWEKKMKRTQIFEVDIERSVQDMLEAEIILDLRISGHLLVGIVKIHSRKAKYLLNECNSIFYQVKIFRTGIIDLPDSKQTAAVNDITLHEFFDNFEDIENNLIDCMLNTNQTLVEEITLKETSEKLTLFDDDDMKDFSFHEDETVTFDDFPLNFDETSQMKHLDISANLNLGVEETKRADNKRQKNPSGSRKKDIFIPETFNEENFIDEIPESFDMGDLLNEENVHSLSDNLDSFCMDFNLTSSDKLKLEPLKRQMKELCLTSNRSQTSHISKNKKMKKRKLRMDYVNVLSYEVIKRQVLDTSDIISVLDLTPATKRLMTLKEVGSAEQLLHLPVLRFLNPKLLKLYQRNLKTCKCGDNLSSHERESFEDLNGPRKKSKSELYKNCAMDKNVTKTFDSASIYSVQDIKNNNTENEFLYLDDNFMSDTEFGQRNEREIDQPVPRKNIQSNSKVQISNANDFECTQASKTSGERWEYALQGKIISTLQCLKLLFEENTVILFSSITQNKNKSWVAQQFLCLLMLKKFQVISLEQTGSFGEIFISSEMNFDVACSKFSNF